MTEKGKAMTQAPAGQAVYVSITQRLAQIVELSRQRDDTLLINEANALCSLVHEMFRATPAGQAERQRFEKWAVSILGDNPTWRESGDCELAWQAWQNSRAALDVRFADRFRQYKRDERGTNMAEVVYWRQQYKQLCADMLAALAGQEKKEPGHG